MSRGTAESLLKQYAEQHALSAYWRGKEAMDLISWGQEHHVWKLHKKTADSGDWEGLSGITEVVEAMGANHLLAEKTSTLGCSGEEAELDEDIACDEWDKEREVVAELDEGYCKISAREKETGNPIKFNVRIDNQYGERVCALTGVKGEWVVSVSEYDAGRCLVSVSLPERLEQDWTFKIERD